MMATAIDAPPALPEAGAGRLERVYASVQPRCRIRRSLGHGLKYGGMMNIMRSGDRPQADVAFEVAYR